MNYTEKVVLLIEDSAADRWVHRELLIASSMTVIEASTLVEGLAVLHREHCDCVVLDLGLPDVTREDAHDGVSIDQIREVGEFPIVVCTGLDYIPPNIAPGAAQAWLRKPVDPAERLAWMVWYAIGYKEGAAELMQLLQDRVEDATAVVTEHLGEPTREAPSVTAQH